MTRRTNATATDKAKVKEEKSKVKEEKKKKKSRGTERVSNDEELDQDAEGSAQEEDQDADTEGEDEDDEEASHSPRGSKRQRVNTDGDARRSDVNGSQQGIISKRVKTLPRGDDGFVPGSIVRIQLQNFLTYDFVEFRPGPYLNMIIGPNGTGKSSIACAIAIGLNWSPSILGRATELNSYVKNNADKGYIEIELKAPKGKNNLIVRRHISANSKGSTFLLNGQSATGNEIKQKMLELNVQVGNLCSFLPQDKVSEFAAMSSQQLLRETQRAAGDERLTSWHDTLISAGKESRLILQSIKEEQEQLRQMIERNEGIEREVQRVRDRQKIEHDIDLLQLLIPVETYRVMRQRFLLAKADQRRLHAKVDLLGKKNKPAHDLLKKLETSHKLLEKDRENIKKATMKQFKKVQGKWDASEKLETEADEVTNRLSLLKKEEKERARRIKNLEVAIKQTQEELDKPPANLGWNMQDLNDEARQINLERSGVEDRKNDVDVKLRGNVDRRARAQVEHDRAQEALKKLNNLDDVKLRNLGQWHRDTADTVVWLRANKHRFKMTVFEPPYMSCTVPNKAFTNAVESCFSGPQMRFFVAQCKEDLDTLNHFINDSQALGRSTRIATWFRAQREDLLVPPPLTREELTELNFDGYALDYLDYPPGMEWFLKREVQLHRTAIALPGRQVDVKRAMDAVARPSQNHPGGAHFINGTTLNAISRSAYGRRAVGNITRDVPQARNFVVPTADPQYKERLDATILTATQEMSMCDEEKAELDVELKRISDEDNKFQKRMNDVRTRKNAILEQEKLRKKAEGRLQSDKTTLKSLLATPPVDVGRAKLKKRLMEISKRRIEITKEYTTLAHNIVVEHEACTKVGLQYLQVGANKAALQTLCERKDEKYQSALLEFTRVDKEFQQIKAESKAVLEQSRQIIADAPEDLQTEYKAIESRRLTYDKELERAQANDLTPPSDEGVDVRSLEELQTELETQRANLDMNLAANAGVVEQYEKRQRDIAQLQQTIAEKEKRAVKIERDIKNARDNWQPALQSLVASIGQKFSAAFDRIGCAGEIRISEHEDYDKWAIDILVKFRDSEKLQLLTGQRQSGGERSLTTILYLLSLTEEARAPFSLVDEINQGMDQRAERMVHNAVVEVTCKPESAQYFLITPKLLPDLQYHERMKILCVNNGEWLPEERNLGNMMNMIDCFVEHRRNQSNAI